MLKQIQYHSSFPVHVSFVFCFLNIFQDYIKGEIFIFLSIYCIFLHFELVASNI